MGAHVSPAVFLDRDGTLMENVHYCNDPARVRVFPGVPEALRELKAAGFHNIIVTNQSGIGRGLVTIDQFAAVQQKLLELIGTDLIVATYYCPDLPGPEARRRKPSPAMILEAKDAFAVDLSRSWLVGDQRSDVQCGRAAGVQPILVRTGGADVSAEKDAVHVAKDFASAARFILRNAGAR